MARKAVSQNGFVANDPSVLGTYQVPDSQVKFQLRRGPCAEALLYVAHWVDQHVEDIDIRKGIRGWNVPDDWSYAPRNVRGSATVVSNHASGTAIDLNATHHPRGVQKTWSNYEILLVHALLRRMGGVIRWGEDYTNAPCDGMHFEINAPEAEVARVMAAIKAAEKAAAQRGEDDVSFKDEILLGPSTARVFKLQHAEAGDLLQWAAASAADAARLANSALSTATDSAAALADVKAEVTGVNTKLDIITAVLAKLAVPAPPTH